MLRFRKVSWGTVGRVPVWQVGQGTFRLGGVECVLLRLGSAGKARKQIKGG